MVIQNALSGVKPVVVALIASAGVTLTCMAVYGTKEIKDVWTNPDFISIGIIIVALLLLRKWKVKPIYIMLGSGVIYSLIQTLI